MDNIKPEVEARRKKILELWQAEIPVKDIAKKIGCSISLVQKVGNSQSGGRAA